MVKDGLMTVWGGLEVFWGGLVEAWGVSMDRWRFGVVCGVSMDHGIIRGKKVSLYVSFWYLQYCALCDALVDFKL